jgi:hypothetical protein
MAYLIWGEVSEDRLAAKPEKRGFLDRVLPWRRPEGITMTEMGQGFRIIDVPCRELDPLMGVFRGYLKSRLTPPWESTAVVLNEYLRIKGVTTIYVRGEQQEKDIAPRWYVQLTFSGCAGQAEVSAEICTHWAELWYQEKREEIAEKHLLPFGFTPSESQVPEDQPPRFLPMGRLGYALRSRYASANRDVQIEPYELLEIDASALEAENPSDTLAFLTDLGERWGEATADGKCRCQMCMPELDPQTFLV